MHEAKAVEKAIEHWGEVTSYVDEGDGPWVMSTLMRKEANQSLVLAGENVLGKSSKGVVRSSDDEVMSYYVDYVVTDWVYFVGQERLSGIALASKVKHVVGSVAYCVVALGCILYYSSLFVIDVGLCKVEG